MKSIVIEERGHDSLSQFEWWHRALRFATFWLVDGTVLAILWMALSVTLWPSAASDSPGVLAPVALLVIINVLWFRFMVRVRIKRKAGREDPA